MPLSGDSLYENIGVLVPLESRFNLDFVRFGGCTP